jgi:hypothetical protein
LVQLANGFRLVDGGRHRRGYLLRSDNTPSRLLKK